MKPLSLRFSLRFLLLATALTPLAIYWFALPTLNARQFSAAINRGDYAAAEKLCLDRQAPFPGDRKEHPVFQPRTLLQSLSWQDVRRGERRLVIGIAYGDSHGLASYSVECLATRRGIEIGMAMP